MDVLLQFIDISIVEVVVVNVPKSCGLLWGCYFFNFFLVNPHVTFCKKKVKGRQKIKTNDRLTMTMTATKRRGQKMVNEIVHHIKELYYRTEQSDLQKSRILIREANKLVMGQSPNIQDAIDLLTCAIDELEQMASHYQMRGTFYMKLEKWNEAYFDFSKAIRIDPGNAHCFAQRGLCLQEMKHLEMAIEDLTSAIKIDETSNHLLLRANVYFAVLEYDAAIDDLTAALEKDNSQPYDLKMKINIRFRRANVYYEVISRY